LVGVGDADACVDHRYFDIIIGILRKILRPNGYGSLSSELEGIGLQVEEHLHEPLLIGRDNIRTALKTGEFRH